MGCYSHQWHLAGQHSRLLLQAWLAPHHHLSLCCCSPRQEPQPPLLAFLRSATLPLQAARAGQSMLSHMPASGAEDSFCWSRQQAQQKAGFSASSFLRQAKFLLKTHLRISDSDFRHCKLYPIYGTGQGSAASPTGLKRGFARIGLCCYEVSF